MLLKLRSVLLWIILFSTVSVGFADAASASLSCSNLLGKFSAPRSIGYYIDAVNSKPRLEPRFLDPVAEADMVNFWQGTQEGPKLLKETLGEQTAFINQQLLAADAGTVKSATAAGFVSMRLRHKWNNKDMSTNLGLSSDALVSKTIEGSHKLVPKTAKAVFIFMHGWGTKTTGHHVAAAFSNFLAPFGIVVLSIDAPHHAYGPRVKDLSPKEYATYLRDLRDELIPKNVPTFIGGHSGGGFIADMMMRFSDDPELALGKAFAGAINLSGPMDGAPGKALAEKNAAEELINTNQEIMNLVPEAERDLSVLLLTQGKASATSGLSAEGFMSSINWTKPKHKGADYIPTLVVMGERDGLYVGRDQVFQDYLVDLENTETHLMGKRPDFKGENTWVSHMIFDHYRPGTKDPETFNVVKDFIEKQVGTPLKKSKGSSLSPDADISRVGIITNVVQEYYNNLAFRKFAKEYTYTTRKASSEAQKLGDRSRKVTGLLKKAQKTIERRKKADPKSPRISTLLKIEASLLKEQQRLKSMMISTFVPDGDLKTFAEKNVSERIALDSELNQQYKDKKNGLRELRELRASQIQEQKKFDALVEKLLDSDSIGKEEVSAAQKDIEAKLDAMIKLQVKMNELNAALVTQNHEQGVFRVNPGPKEIEVYKQLDAAYADYNAAMAKGRSLVAQAVGEGLASDVDLALFKTLYGSVEAYLSGSATPESTLGKAERLSRQMNDLDRAIQKNAERVDKLLQEYVAKVTPGLFIFSETTLYKEMDRPISEILENASGIEPLWRVWSDIWKERPPEQGTSLY